MTLLVEICFSLSFWGGWNIRSTPTAKKILSREIVATPHPLTPIFQRVGKVKRHSTIVENLLILSRYYHRSLIFCRTPDSTCEPGSIFAPQYLTLSYRMLLTKTETSFRGSFVLLKRKKLLFLSKDLDII